MALCCVGSRRAFAWAGLIGAVAVALTAMASPAEAARKKKRHVGGGYAPPYAAMVVDARTGRTLHAVNEDAPRIPASITKVMTLYLVFEQLERGRLRMDTPISVSSYAARQAPSKIGFQPGETIETEDAIKALITKSANDVSVAIAEHIGGSEEEFARMMTARARSLGMSRTSFHNPHGLPHDPPNITTARDLTILARAIQERFPRYYPMFSTRTFHYAGGAYRNHNKLLGRIDGVDGIKTGYTRASGFNLMTSAKADGRHIVSIVLGGRSGATRDRIMADLVVASLPKAATTGRASTMVAEASEPVERQQTGVVGRLASPQPKQIIVPAEAASAVAAVMPAPRPRGEIVAEARPIAASAYTATTTTPSTSRPQALNGQPLNLSAIRSVTATTTPSAMRWSIGAAPADGKILRPPANVDVTSSIGKAPEPDETPARSALTKVEERRPEPIVAQAKAPEESKRPAIAASSVAKTDLAGSDKWVIQLGATDDEGKAKAILASARAKSGASLAAASPFTEAVQKGGSTLFRARFAGFDDSKDAQNACARLKRDGFSCFATRG